MLQFATWKDTVVRRIITSARHYASSPFPRQQTEGLIHVEKQFEAHPPAERNKENFLAAILIFKERKGRSYVDFINSSLKYMKEYGVHKDIEVYKALLDIFPKGKLIPTNQWQKVFMHYPLQQNCCVKVLDEMEWHGVHPDKEVHDIVVNAFGEWNFASRKIKRMLYWMPKLRYSNKYIDRRQIENKKLSPEQLAGLALKMMSRDPGSTYHFCKLPKRNPVVEDEWIAWSQSILQQNLLSRLPENTDIFIDTSELVYVMEHPVKYVVLKCRTQGGSLADFKEERDPLNFASWYKEWSESREYQNSIHEQPHETILAIACLSTSNNATAAKWIDLLKIEKMNVRLRLDK
ncbi:unnamed protein product, partial [Mesorhabditis spiculigera]